MKRRSIVSKILCLVILSASTILGLTGCGGDSGPTPGNATITTTSLPPGTINRAYSTSVSGSGGAAPYTWSVSPALPGNLSLDTATGAINGTPATQATTIHTFTMHDSSVPVQTVAQPLSVTILPPLAITSTTLPDASIGSAYNQPVQTVGGVGPLTVSIVLPGTGTLPSTLSLNPATGVVAGTPVAPAGTFPFTVQVADTTGQQDTKALSVRVIPSTPPQITTTSLQGGTINQPYNQTLQATGGIGSLTWVISGGSLPAGLSLTPAGTITGTPTNAGTSNFTVTVTDAFNQSATMNLSIIVTTALEITTPSLPNANENLPYTATLQSSGGTPPVSWSVTPNLPGGLILNPLTGEISGAPAPMNQGPHLLTFSVQDSRTPTPGIASKQLNLTVLPP